MHRKLIAIPLLLLASAAAGRTAGGEENEAADTVIVVDKVQVTAIKQDWIFLTTLCIPISNVWRLCMGISFRMTNLTCIL